MKYGQNMQWAKTVTSEIVNKNLEALKTGEITTEAVGKEIEDAVSERCSANGLFLAAVREVLIPVALNKVGFWNVAK